MASLANTNVPLATAASVNLDTGTVAIATTQSGSAGVAAFTANTATAATGKNFFDNLDNWSGGAVPIDADDIVYDSGNVDCLYNIDQSSLTPASLTITAGYTGKIGLPITNKDSSQFPYVEYRDRYLKLCDSSDNTTTLVAIGEGEGAGSGRLLLDFNTGQVTGNIYRTGQPPGDGSAPLQIKGTHASTTWQVVRGRVDFAPLAGESCVIATLEMAYVTNQASDAQVFCGAGCTPSTIDKEGGVLQVNSAIGTLIKNSSGETTINGTGAVAGLIVDGGTIYYNTSGTLGGNPVVSGSGRLDFSRDTRSKTITNPVEIYGDKAIFWDPHKVAGNVVLDLNQTGNSDKINLGTNLRITRGAVV